MRRPQWLIYTVKSTTKVWFFLIVMSLLTIFLGYKLMDRTGLLLGFFVSVIFNGLVISTGNSFLLKKLNAREVKGQDPWNLNERVEHWAEEVFIKAPKVFLIESKSAIAFSNGSPWGQSAICVSTSLLEKLTPAEVEAVLVHQVCHILRMDTLSFGAASIVANSLVALAEVLDLIWPFRRIKRFVNRRPFHFLISPIAWTLIRLNIRESTFFENDDLASQILPDRKVLASALCKLESLSQARPLSIPDCSSHLFVVNPRGIREHNWFYMTHPRMSTRIKRMVGYEPL
jgi:heat shock protein HtpX